MKWIWKIYPFIGYILVLLITTSVTLYGVKIFRDRDAADQWVAHTDTVIATADQLLIGLEEMESGFQQYMFTGQNDFLKTYQSGKAQYETSIKSLLDLTKDNPSQEVRWKEIQALENQWETDWVAKGVQIRQDVYAGKASSKAVLDFVTARGGKADMDAIRAKIAAGRQEEADLLKSRTHVEQSVNNLAYQALVGGVILSVIIGVVFGILLTRTNKKNREHIEIQHFLLQEREKERMKIARDLHDGPVQDLLATTFTLQSLSYNVDAQAAGSLNAVKSILQKVIADLRAYAMELRSPVLTQFGLEKAIQSHLEVFQEKHPEIKISFEGQQTGDLLAGASRDTLYRIYQEVMNNIARHSQATEVSILFQKLDGQAVLEIRDNGVGFDLPADWLSLARQGHLGLVGIRERADVVGGQVEIKSHPGSGTCLKVIVPIK